MTKNSMSKNGANKPKPVEGPFDPILQAQARELADRYHIILEAASRGGYLGKALEMPTVISRGLTADACMSATRAALTVAIASLLEAGVAPPEPFSERRRAEQMNIRLDALEKMVLKQAAAKQGFRNISEYVRVVALRDARN